MSRFLDFVANNIIHTAVSTYVTTANLTPVYANSTANREVPLTFIGSNPGVNYVWPWYQNTSTIANGYIANSTGTFTPQNAAFITGNVLANTIATDYYKIVQTQYTICEDASITDLLCIGVYSNVADTYFQIIPFDKYASNNTAILNTNGITTLKTSSAAPYTDTFTIYYNGQSTTTFDTQGYYIRNITNNSELTIFYLSHSVTLYSV